MKIYFSARDRIRQRKRIGENCEFLNPTPCKMNVYVTYADAQKRKLYVRFEEDEENCQKIDLIIAKYAHLPAKRFERGKILSRE